MTIGPQRAQVAVAPSATWPALVLVLTFAVYAGTLAFGFVFDDFGLIVSNGAIQSWHYLGRYFTSHFFSYQYPHMLGNYYRPLMLLTMRLSYAAFGLAAWKWHLLATGLHACVTLLVYALVRRMGCRPWTAAPAALLFGLHPIHTEVAAYVSGMAESQTALFVLVSLWFFARARNIHGEVRVRRTWLLVASLACYAAGLLTKEDAIVLPLLIAAWVAIFPHDAPASPPKLREWLGSVLTALIPYLVVTGGYLVARRLALRSLFFTITPLSFSTAILTLPGLLWFYLRKLTWPAGLSPYYDTPYITHAGLYEFFLPLAALLVFGALIFLWWRWERRAEGGQSCLLAIAVFLFVVPLLPVLNLRVFDAGEIAHDRYLYLPSVGFFLLAALALRRLANLPRLGSAWLRAAVVLIVAAALAVATVRQTLFWADELQLDTRAHQIAPENVRATTSLAAAAAARGLLPAAMALYREALARQPNFWRANVNLAYLYYQQGNLTAAEEYFQRAIAADPVDGNQYLYLGLTRLRLGKVAEAEADARTALRVRPDGPGYHYALGLILRQEGRAAEAREEFARELAVHPSHAGARAALAETAASEASVPR